MATTIKTTPLTAQCGALVSLLRSPPAVLFTGGPPTLAAAKQFVGREIEVHSKRADNPTTTVRLDRVTQNKETGEIVFWAVGQDGHGGHLRMVGKRD